jgi:hypothetical protein
VNIEMEEVAFPTKKLQLTNMILNHNDGSFVILKDGALVKEILK